MNKEQFINELREQLNVIGVTDVEEIISDYEQHFSIKISDGYYEEEIAKKLGSAKQLALLFASDDTESIKKRKTSGSQKILSITGLVFLDIVVFWVWIDPYI